MSYIGAPLVSTNFVLDQFTATAGQTVFTLTRAPASAQSIAVGIDGVLQEPGTAYTVSGTTLTMTSGVPLNSRVWVVHLGVRGTTTTPADDSVVTASINDAAITFAKLATAAVATQAEQETGTATDKLVVTGRQKYHPSAAKAWIKWGFSGGTPTPVVSFNVSSMTDVAVGAAIVNFTVAFSSVHYVMTGNTDSSFGSASYIVQIGGTVTASSHEIYIQNGGGAASDNGRVYNAFFGDQ